MTPVGGNDRMILHLAGMELARRIARDRFPGAASNPHPGDDSGRVMAHLWRQGRRADLLELWVAIVARLEELTEPDDPDPTTGTDLLAHLEWAVVDQAEAAQIKDWLLAHTGDR